MIANVSSATGEVRAETLSLHTALVFSLRSSHNLPSSLFMFFFFFFFLNLLPTSYLKLVDFYSLSEQKSGYLSKRMENRKPMSYIQACMQGICHNIIKGLLPSCQIISNANNLSNKIYKSLFASVNLPSSHFNLIHNFYLMASALWTFL